MKKLQATHYILLLIVFVAIISVVVAFTKSMEAAIAPLLTGIGGILGLTTAAIIRKKTALGKEMENMSSQARRQLTTLLIIGVLLTMAVIILLVLYLR